MEDYPIGAIPDIAHWSENYALAGFDPASGIDIFMGLGRWRKDQALWREMIGIALPDGSLLAHRSIGNALATPTRPGATNLKIEIEKDGFEQTWSFVGAMRRVPVAKLASEILIDGPLERTEFHCRFRSALPSWDLGNSGEASQMAGHAHVEQIGHLAMDIAVGSETFHFETEGNRDHSRGPRLVGKLTRHVWCHGIFDDGLRFQAYQAFEGDEVTTPVFTKAAVIPGRAADPRRTGFWPATARRCADRPYRRSAVPVAAVRGTGGRIHGGDFPHRHPHPVYAPVG